MHTREEHLKGVARLFVHIRSIDSYNIVYLVFNSFHTNTFVCLLVFIAFLWKLCPHSFKPCILVRNIKGDCCTRRAHSFNTFMQHSIYLYLIPFIQRNTFIETQFFVLLFWEEWGGPEKGRLLVGRQGSWCCSSGCRSTTPSA